MVEAEEPDWPITIETEELSEGPPETVEPSEEDLEYNVFCEWTSQTVCRALDGLKEDYPMLPLFRRELEGKIVATVCGKHRERKGYWMDRGTENLIKHFVEESVSKRIAEDEEMVKELGNDVCEGNQQPQPNEESRAKPVANYRRSEPLVPVAPPRFGDVPLQKLWELVDNQEVLAWKEEMQQKAWEQFQRILGNAKVVHSTDPRVPAESVLFALGFRKLAVPGGCGEVQFWAKPEGQVVYTRNRSGSLYWRQPRLMREKDLLCTVKTSHPLATSVPEWGLWRKSVRPQSLRSKGRWWKYQC